MGKTVQSTNPHFSGHVVISDPMTLPQVAAFERALANTRALSEPTLSEAQASMLPGVLACVQEWHLAHLDAGQLSLETFPATPRKHSAALIEWLTQQVLSVYLGEIADPN